MTIKDLIPLALILLIAPLSYLLPRNRKSRVLGVIFVALSLLFLGAAAYEQQDRAIKLLFAVLGAGMAYRFFVGRSLGVAAED